MKITTILSTKALFLRNIWENERPVFYRKMRKDQKAMEIINALAEMCAGGVNMKELSRV